MFINKKTYGLSPNNPLRTTGSKMTKAILDICVTNKKEFILYHKADIVINNKRRPIDLFEICAGNGDRFTIYVDSNCKKGKWKPPFGFKFYYYYSPYYKGRDIVISKDINPKDVVFVGYHQEVWNVLSDYEMDTSQAEQYRVILTSSYGTTTYCPDFPTRQFEEYFFIHSAFSKILDDKQTMQRIEFNLSRLNDDTDDEWILFDR